MGDVVDKDLRDVQPHASNNFMLGGSLGSFSSLLHSLTRISVRLGSPLMSAGMLTKLFLLKSSTSRESKWQSLLSIAPSTKLQSLRYKDFKKHKPDKEGNRKPIASDFSVCRNLDIRDEIQLLDFHTLHPLNDNFSRFVKRTSEIGGCVIAVPSA